MIEEEWREVPKFSGYRVSNFGKVQSCWKLHGGGRSKGKYFYYQSDRWKNLLINEDEKGRFFVRLRYQHKKYKHCHIQNLVLEAFVGPRPDGMYGCHNDGNPKNNYLGNLRWDTPSNNQLDRIKHGTDLRGDKHPRSKLKSYQIVEIRRRCSLGESFRSIAKDFNVHPTLIGYICKKKIWKHID